MGDKMTSRCPRKGDVSSDKLVVCDTSLSKLSPLWNLVDESYCPASDVPVLYPVVSDRAGCGAGAGPTSADVATSSRGDAGCAVRS